MFTPKRLNNRSIEAEKLGLFFYESRITLKRWSKNKGFYGKNFKSSFYITANNIAAFRNGIFLPNGLEYNSFYGKWSIKASKNKIIYRPFDKDSLTNLCYSLAGHLTKWDNLDIFTFINNSSTKYNKSLKLMQQQTLDMAKELEVLILKDLEKDCIIF